LQFDVANVCLWRGTKRIALRPKDCAVLQCLASHPGQVVAKATLLDAGWPEVYVSEGVLKDNIHRLRRALGEQGHRPHWIETVARRGYRLLHPLPLVDASKSTTEASTTPSMPAWLVGREAVIVQMQEWFDRACQGSRQLGLLTGEVGIGKTTMVEAFLSQVVTRNNVQILRGQCVQHYGVGEAYLPIFEALYQACQGEQRDRYLAVLRQLAPTWLVHMPGLLEAADYTLLQRQHGSSTRERMLRELANAVDALARDTPLVLVLEDLHWSDHSTLDLVALVAQRQAPARLLLLGTLRPEEVLATEHPLRTMLPTLRRQSRLAELPLTRLTAPHVATYLTARFPASALPADLISRLHHRSEGHPLFLVNTVDHLVARGILYLEGET
jgi:predicted ATPase